MARREKKKENKNEKHGKSECGWIQEKKLKIYSTLLYNC